MTRPHSTRLTAVLVGGVGVLFAVGAATASASPSAALRGGATITAHVSGQKSGEVCRIVAAGVDMPWRPVGSGGTVDLDTGPVRAGRHAARVVCEDARIGDASAHAVGKQDEVFTGHWAPAFEFLHHHRVEVLAPRDRSGP
ncbi:hypothetical protein [Nocardia transvalensis]|uniref:hypothetical protein n=1 Tax=Nocardia transvalensis TaxID=37333 RepID=UPI00189537E0|nr:hypothetical protein [Nocardia transvalensis]MBF6332062.1 hypothetical protein [Nocardia transvalensis]